MKTLFQLLSVLIFLNANSQKSDPSSVSDSLYKIMEEAQFTSEEEEVKMTGKILPDFAVKDLNGKTFNTSSFKNGGTTFLNFWYLSCPPCIAEIPNLNRLYDMTKDKKGVQFFAITFEAESTVKETIKKYDIQFPILMMSSKDLREISILSGFPINMVLDKKGRIFSFLSGGHIGPEFELFWSKQIEKTFKGDTAIALNPIQIPKNLPGITFIDSSKIESLDELSDYFKGQPVYLSLWSSMGCMPCRQDFKLKSATVDSFLKNNNIVRMYLSIDNPWNRLAEEKWESLIYEYQPAGYHMRVGVKLYKDVFNKLFPRGTKVQIPKYFIVRNGEMKELDASKVKTNEILMIELKEKLKR